MAYVAISNSLESDVSNRIRAMHQKELNTAGPEPDVTLQGTEDWLLAAVWREHLHLKDLLPKSWTPVHGNVILRVLHTAGEKKIHFSVSVDINLGMKVPPNSTSRFIVDVLPDVTPRVTEHYQWCLRRKEINDRWEGVRSQVLTFLKNCKSLNEGLKLWPELRHYIPQTYLERVEEKRGKAEKNTAAIDALKNMDTDALQAAAVIARMSE